MESSLLFFLFLFLALSLQIHARESQFFSKITHAVEASPKVSTSPIADEPAMDLPPQSHNGHGLYGRRDPDQFPSSTSTAAATTTASYNYNTNPNPNNAAYREPETTAEFSTESYVNKERNYPNNIPSGFNNAESFSTENYENNKGRNYPNNIPSGFNNAESFSTESYENNKGRNYPNNIPSGFNSAAEFSTENYENNKGRSYPNNIPSGFTSTEHSNANNYIPSTFSDEEFNRGTYETKVPNYSNNDEQYGMSDTRSLENGKYFYDVSAERSSKEYEPVKGNSERYGSYGYKNEAGGYQNNQENKEMQEEYVP